jgi:hypothetical protein
MRTYFWFMHQEDQLLEDQMDIWTFNANGARLGFCSGRTWFVAHGGNDGASGTATNSPLATLTKALSKVTGPDGNPGDVILLRIGAYALPEHLISTACTLSATRGPVIIGNEEASLSSATVAHSLQRTHP